MRPNPVLRRNSASSYQVNGSRMIRTINVQNFRCFKELEIRDCKRINVIVGENGSGKTSLLESIFFTLGSTSEMGLRFRQFRGLDGSFQGSPRRIEDAIWRNLFYDGDNTKTIKVSLTGNGPEARTVSIARKKAETFLNFSDAGKPAEISEPITITWKDAEGDEHIVTPQVGAQGIQFPSTGEDLSDFFFFYASMHAPSAETAARFSEMKKSDRQKLIRALTKEYPWIEDLSIEIAGGGPAVFATIKGSEEKRELPFLSGGINKIVSILIALASRSHSVVLIDEIENGLYYSHLTNIWRLLIDFAREFDTQLFVSSHSLEMLKALVEAAGSNNSDIDLWRLERSSAIQPELFQFSGDRLNNAIVMGAEPRGVGSNA